jgi:hypothetical protein
LITFAIKSEGNAREVFDRFYGNDFDCEFGCTLEEYRESYGCACLCKKRYVVKATSGDPRVCGCSGKVLKIFEDSESKKISAAKCENCQYSSVGNPYWFVISILLISSGCCSVCC